MGPGTAGCVGAHKDEAEKEGTAGAERRAHFRQGLEAHQMGEMRDNGESGRHHNFFKNGG